MRWKTLVVVTTVSAAAAFAANASVVLSDSFNDGTSSMLNWSGDSVFASLSSFGGGVGVQSTDYVADSNSFGITCFGGSQGCVDLDGSEPDGTANPVGVLQSNMSLTAGTYTLTFELSGNQRGGSDQITDVDVAGMQVWTSGDLASSSPWTKESVTFTTGGGNLDFVEFNSGGMRNDDIGNLLDDVVLVTGTGAVPEPATWALMIAGFAGLGGMLRRRARMLTV